MAYVYASLAEALEKEGLTQAELADRVTRRRLKRQNGKPLRLSQNFVSQLVNGERMAGTKLAKAICSVLGNKIDPAVLVFGPSRSAA